MVQNLLVGALAAGVLSGCIVASQDLAGAARVTAVLREPLTIPAHRAHASFQGGRQVIAVSRYDPWCELEIRTVAEVPQVVQPTRLAVGRIGQAFIRDYNTRIPVAFTGFSCTDLVFKETTWWLRPTVASPVMYLRCLAPYVHCRIGPPLSPEAIQAVVGPQLEIDVAHVPVHAPNAAAGS
ncbi:MAG: hypothetical protein WCA32_16660 [Chromatiaceae bacterium]|jgi:hypothetical protein